MTSRVFAAWRHIVCALSAIGLVGIAIVATRPSAVLERQQTRPAPAAAQLDNAQVPPVASIGPEAQPALEESDGHDASDLVLPSATQTPAEQLTPTAAESSTAPEARGNPDGDEDGTVHGLLTTDR